MKHMLLFAVVGVVGFFGQAGGSEGRFGDGSEELVVRLPDRLKSSYVADVRFVDAETLLFVVRTGVDRLPGDLESLFRDRVSAFSLDLKGNLLDVCELDISVTVGVAAYSSGDSVVIAWSEASWPPSGDKEGLWLAEFKNGEWRKNRVLEDVDGENLWFFRMRDCWKLLVLKKEWRDVIPENLDPNDYEAICMLAPDESLVLSIYVVGEQRLTFEQSVVVKAGGAPSANESVECTVVGDDIVLWRRTCGDGIALWPQTMGANRNTQTLSFASWRHGEELEWQSAYTGNCPLSFVVDSEHGSAAMVEEWKTRAPIHGLISFLRMDTCDVWPVSSSPFGFGIAGDMLCLSEGSDSWISVIGGMMSDHFTVRVMRENVLVASSTISKPLVHINRCWLLRNGSDVYFTFLTPNEVIVRKLAI